MIVTCFIFCALWGLRWLYNGELFFKSSTFCHYTFKCDVFPVSTLKKSISKVQKKKKNQQEKRFPWHTTLLSWQSASTSSFSFFFSIFPYDLALTEKPICGHFDMSGTSWRSLGRRVKRLIVFFLPCAILITYDWPTSKPIVIITLNGQ